MSLQGFQETLVAQQAAGTLFNTYTTAKTVIPPTALYQLPVNYFQIGKALRISALLGFSNIVTTPGTAVFQVMIGGVAAYTTGNIQINATAHTLAPVWVDILLTCRAIGSGTGANLMGMGRVQGMPFTLTAGQTDETNTPGILATPATAPAVGSGFDSTITNILDFWAGFSISNAGNGVQLQQYVVESLN